MYRAFGFTKFQHFVGPLPALVETECRLGDFGIQSTRFHFGIFLVRWSIWLGKIVNEAAKVLIWTLPGEDLLEPRTLQELLVARQGTH